MSTVEQPAALTGRLASDRVTVAARRELPRPSGYLVALAVSLLIAAVSLVFASSPSYDPWAWLIWGRQIVHLDLITFGGPTWKPLPVLFTTAFAPFGSAAPPLWLLVARTGGVMGIMMAAWLAFRLTGQRAGSRSAGVLAGVLAASGVFLLYQYLNSTASGESEGLLVALVLLAIMRDLDGAPRSALALGFGAALIRPETWPFFALYCLYVWRRDPGARKLAAVLIGLIPVLWFAPELWGSGSLGRGIDWAQYPRAGSAAFASCPFCTELTAHGWPLLLPSFKVGVALAIVALLVVWKGSGRLARPERVLITMTVVAVGWLVEDAVLTQIGFTGSDRYLIAPEALLVVVGAVGWGMAVAWAARRRRSVIAPTIAVAGCWVLLTALAPEPGPHLDTLVSTARFDSSLQRDLGAALAGAGGSGRLLACGPITTNPSEAPLTAWTLGVPLRRTESARGSVVIQSGNAQDPAMQPHVPNSYRQLARAGAVRIYAHCAG